MCYFCMSSRPDVLGVVSIERTGEAGLAQNCPEAIMDHRIFPDLVGQPRLLPRERKGCPRSNPLLDPLA